MFRTIALIVAATTLSACSPEFAEGEPAAASSAVAFAPEATLLGGVDLAKPVRILGTEPFWALTVDDNDILLEKPDAAATHYTPKAFHIAGNRAELRSTDLSVVLTAATCSDGMSYRTYPLTAEVRIGEQVLKGCAIAVSALGPARP